MIMQGSENLIEGEIVLNNDSMSFWWMPTQQL